MLDEREEAINEAIQKFIKLLPDDECFRVDIKYGKDRKFRSVSITRKKILPDTRGCE